MKPLKISRNKLGRDLKVPPRRINEIVHGKRSVTADTALRLARYLGTTPDFWMNLQAHYDLDVEKDKKARTTAREVKAHPTARASAG